ncbi:M13 family peptidase [Sphingomonas ginkgonis]|uniref:M13 family peptidase n=1 Tax=Sphingomonas ginkgonis TaxID=2315330 RepID=A0A429VBP1_9SPHN|nr:M13 family metallopeptidase [Sphingomonas ginkgonis]RST31419.1 M13 family peptidase [Sphingomonas ginkgonis]
MNLHRLILAGTALALVAATPAGAARPAFGSWGYDSSAMDRAVKPGDDFFAFVNGSWDKRTQIAPDRTFAGIDSVLNDKIDSDVRAIVEDMAKSPDSNGRIGQQVGDYYASYMDQPGIEAQGLGPVRPVLARIAALRDKSQVAHLFVDPSFTGPIGVGILPDFKDPSRYIAAVAQSGLGLPNRDYYLLTGEKYDRYRAGYRDYMVKTLSMAGFADAAARADRVIALETALARSQWTPERSRDVLAVYNPMDRAKLTALAPQFDWTPMLASVGLGNVPTIMALQPSAISDAGKLLDTTPLDTWKDYLAFHFLRTHAQYLPKSFDDANFDFYSKQLRDVPVQRDRWKRGVTEVNAALGEGVGQIYVQRHYPAESDRQMGELIGDIRAALHDKINHASWMDASTRAQALAKLAAFDPRTGHPVRYIDYSSLQVRRGDLLGNALRAERFGWDLQVSRLPKPVDRSLWGMLPQTNNAYYDPTMNQITFPAAILQPPYFDPNADPASNYGSIGATIGHEIGHGFDDQGRHFDGSGKLRDWWSPDAAKLYTAHADRLVKQYDAYEPIPGVRIKGQLTLGENLGDLGGLEVAYAAYRRYVAKHGEPPVIDGLTGDQRFFIAYGYSWETKTREGALRAQLLTNEHSPAKYRVNGVVRNMDAWYSAFNVKPGDALYLAPADRVHVW